MLSIVGLAGLLFGIIEGPEQGWTDPQTVAGFVVGIVFLVGFGLWERHTDQPMLELGWFSDRRFAVGSGTITLAFFAAFGVFFLATQYFQFILGYSPLVAGLATLPLAAVLVAIAPRSARLAARFGPNVVVSTGLGVLAVGLLYLAVVSQVDTAYLVIAPGLMLVGAALQVAQQIPDPVLAEQLAAAARTAFVNGFRTAFVVAAAIAAIAAVLVRVFGPHDAPGGPGRSAPAPAVDEPVEA